MDRVLRRVRRYASWVFALSGVGLGASACEKGPLAKGAGNVSLDAGDGASSTAAESATLPQTEAMATRETSGANAGTTSSSLSEAPSKGLDAGGNPSIGGETSNASGSTARATSDVGGEAGLADAAAVSSLNALLDVYRTWQTFTEEPQNISASIFALCRLPSAAEQAFVESEHGHEFYLLDWLNPAARADADRLGKLGGEIHLPDAAPSPGEIPGFAVGSAIVKEKLVRTAEGYELAALGLMVKQEPGYDPATGDWEFGYWEPGTGLMSGEAVNMACGPCHASSPTDFVYLDQQWRLPP